MKMNILLTTLLSFLSSTAFAFYSVTEILPSGKLIICNESGQIRRGNIIDVYERTNSRSRFDKSTAKSRESKLPEVGEKIKLTHKDFHPKGKNSVYHTEELGTAIISGDSLEGEIRVVRTIEKNRYARVIEKSELISREENLDIQKKCLIAIPENGLQLKEKAYVSW